MAWSDAARQAAAAVRRLHAEARASFHEYGTPRFDPYSVGPEHRKKVAEELRAVRAQARAGVRPDGAAQEKIRAAARAEGMRTHGLHPIRNLNSQTPAAQRMTRRLYSPSGKVRRH